MPHSRRPLPAITQFEKAKVFLESWVESYGGSVVSATRDGEIYFLWNPQLKDPPTNYQEEESILFVGEQEIISGANDILQDMFEALPADTDVGEKTVACRAIVSLCRTLRALAGGDARSSELAFHNTTTGKALSELCRWLQN